ncbi:Thioredoxin [Musa troglodytarum]|uniref:Protein disulfide isomerase-like 1-4 n=1 Tax=Musa troglodytarum TaxID=320322 RepID=A0A9E7HR96_9LILI|nr:Thioredoxin [Musa troglodytarum]
MASRALLALAISSLLLVHAALAFAPKGRADLDHDEEDLSFLDEEDNGAADSHDDGGLGHYADESHSEADEEPEVAGHDQYDAFDDAGYGSHDASPTIDETDVVVLTDGNFSDFLAKNRHVMVEFYAPWCGHCQALAPEYAAAATALRGEDVVLAKVDGTEENELAQRFELQGFPTVLFFIDGVHKDYPGQRSSRDAIVTWIKKKIGPGVQNITTIEEAEKILTSDSKVVLGFLDSLVGDESQELSSASKLEDDINFYQTVNPDVAKLFHIDPNAKRPSLVLLKKEAEKISYHDGQFSKSAIVDFVFANKLPLVTTFTMETAPEIFENPIKKQLLLFAIANDTNKVMPAFQEAAKLFKGKLIFVYVEMDNEDVGKPVSDYFGVTGDGPQVLAYSGNEDAKKFFLDGEVTLDNVKSFAEGFLDDKLKPFYKSDPIPETNDGDVKIVVGKNFDEIVLDESKDVLLEIYAPWCGHCQALEPTYNKLAKHLRGIESLIIAKMDGTTNEHPRAKTDGFPTLVFFPAGNKSFDPITVDTDRTVKAFYIFVKQHAAIPFKLQKPKSETTTGGAASLDGEKSAKDEL